jgi:hypothetical protein
MTLRLENTLFPPLGAGIFDRSEDLGIPNDLILEPAEPASLEVILKTN